MSHDLHATWACAEIARIMRNDQQAYFSNSGFTSGWTVAAGREGGRLWPLADGVITSYNTTQSNDIYLAIEFKRTNEGLHGTLTALGQSLAYLHKGYHGSIIVIPEKYTSHNSPGTHLDNVLSLTANNMPIGVFSYQEPDSNKVSPFEGKIKCHRMPNFSQNTLVPSPSTSSRPKSSTLWAHVREGMSYPDVFYKYCKMVKFVTANESDKVYILPQEIISAIHRLDPQANPFHYLSYTTNQSILDRTWRHVWFEYYFHEKLMPLFIKDPATGHYSVNYEKANFLKNDHEKANFLSGRNDSPKNKLVDELNQKIKNENKAWEDYVVKVRAQAHSYREVIDSGLYHLNLIDSDGKLTNIGYRFVDEADKEGTVYSSTSMQVLRGAALIYGNFSAFLHYIHQLSDELFNEEALYFTEVNIANKVMKFKNAEYKAYLYNKMRNELSLILTSSLRSPSNPRQAFQAEIPFLKYLGILPNKAEHENFRIGVGLVINWPVVQESIDFMRNNNL